jgi:hypothetical protein
LEIGAGHGRDTVFFASKGLSVDALDYHSIMAIKISGEMAQEKKLKIKPRVYDDNKPFPFQMPILMRRIPICCLT